MDIISLNKVKKVEEVVKELKAGLGDLSSDLTEVERVLSEVNAKAHEHLNLELLNQLELNTAERLSYGSKELVTDTTMVEYLREYLNLELLNQLELNATGRLAYGSEELLTDTSIAEYLHEHINKETLDRITIDVDGSLLFDGRKIESEITLEYLSNYMKREEFTSDVNVGNVKKSDSALKIDGVENIQPLSYYGKDINGSIGFHILPTSNSEEGKVEQRVLLNVNSGQIYTIQSDNDLSKSKAIIQAYKYVKGEQDIISTIKEFNNGEKENFFYDENNILFNADGCSIKNVFGIETTKSVSLYESETINRAEFIKINIIERD